MVCIVGRSGAKQLVISFPTYERNGKHLGDLDGYAAAYRKDNLSALASGAAFQHFSPFFPRSRRRFPSTAS